MGLCWKDFIRRTLLGDFAGRTLLGTLDKGQSL